MPRSALRRATELTLVGLTALTALAFPGSRPALAGSPSADDFQIVYFITDEQGQRGRQMTLQDMQLFVNQARCECEQKIISRITFQGSGVDAEQIFAMVGQNCALAQSAPGIGTYALCAQIATGLPQIFQVSAEYAFEPIWLAYGVEGGVQAIEEATPKGQCSGQTGSGGIWMCAGINTCQMGDFFMQGSTNINIPDGEPASGIQFDFQPPVSPPSNFSASPGDSAVRISWQNTAPGDIAGYRVLCADENGNPVQTNYSFSPPTATSLAIGTNYYTAGNLCPGGTFGPGYSVDGGTTGDGDPGDGDPGDGDPGDGDPGDGDGDPGDGDPGDGDPGDGDPGDGDPDGCEEGTVGCPCIGGDEGECIDGSCFEGTCYPSCTGELGCACTADNTCDEPLVCDGTFCRLPASGIYSLDWAYVCSDHLGFNTNSTRIEGLENGKTYQFLVVAYDRAGNPVSGEVIEARPVPTSGLWEQCENQGDICGDGWTCAVVDEPGGLGWSLAALGLFGLGGLALRRRRRA
jgi:MYXO-CTERM domain-containing protein